MPTQKAGYYLADGARVPSVTTVISRFKDAGGLIHWAWALGKEGKDYKEERDKAADAGTLAHAAVEAWIHEQPYAFEGPDEICGKARKAFDAFLSWAGQSQLKITHTEVPLISEKYRFGGTLDAMTISGKRALMDWKSSNRTYGEYLIQVRAYGQLWNENFPADPVTGGYDLVRFDKTYGDFHHHHWDELEGAWKAFLNLRELYDLDKELKARAA